MRSFEAPKNGVIVSLDVLTVKKRHIGLRQRNTRKRKEKSDCHYDRCFLYLKFKIVSHDNSPWRRLELVCEFN